MKIPQRVQIGGTSFEVKIVDKWPDGADADGECYYNQETGDVLFIKESLSEDAKGITFLHEAMHAMNSTMNHEFLDSFAQQMYAFLKLNKLDFSK